jgi:hypothetical protein
MQIAIQSDAEVSLHRLFQASQGIMRSCRFGQHVQIDTLSGVFSWLTLKHDAAKHQIAESL